MKTLLLIVFIFTSTQISSQIQLTKDYKIYEAFKETDATKNLFYTWIFDGETYYMNFPRSTTGLENLKDKVEYIISQSDVEDIGWNDNIISKENEDIDDVSKVFQLIMKDKIFLSFGYFIGEKKLAVNCGKDSFVIYINNRD